MLGLVAEVFRLHPLDLAVALDDDRQTGLLVSNHRVADAPLEGLQDKIAVLGNDAADVLLWSLFRLHQFTTPLST